MKESFSMAKGTYLGVVKGNERPAPSEARKSLLAAIERRTAAIEAVADNGRKINDLSSRKWAAEDAVSQAQTAVEHAKAMRSHRVLNPDLPAAEMTVRQAQDALEEAEATVNTLVGARDLANSLVKGLESEVEYSRWELDRAIPKVLSDDPATKRLCEAYERLLPQFVKIRAAVGFLQRKGGLPEGYRPNLNTYDWPTDGDPAWRAAFDALHTDPNSPLPEDA